MSKRERIKTLETIPPDASTEECIAIIARNELRIEKALEEFPNDEGLLDLLDLTKQIRLTSGSWKNSPR